MIATSLLVLSFSLIGLVVGSFLNVVIARRGYIDWRERKTLDGRSRCPKCEHTITWYENIPLVSWLLLRGKCSDCKERISFRYPLIELITAVLWALVAYTADGVADLITGVLLISILIPIAAIDFELRVIPDELNYILIWVGFACALGFGPRPRFMATENWWIEVLVASTLLAVFLLIPSLLTGGRGMGMGDVKLVFGLGAVLGAPAAAGIFFGFLAALIPSIALMLKRGIKKGRKEAIPFGPFLALGGIIAWFFGPQLLDAYLSIGS